jgi:hypothetical protein
MKTEYMLRAVVRYVNAFNCLAYDWSKMNERLPDMTVYIMQHLQPCMAGRVRDF